MSALACLALLVAPAQWGPVVLDPADYHSSDRAYTLHVDPSSSDGSGAGDHRLVHRGKERWSATLPFTLRRAAVSDEGYAVGYALTDGDGFGGELAVAVLSPAGRGRAA